MNRSRHKLALVAVGIGALIGCSSTGSHTESRPEVQDQDEAPVFVVRISESGAPFDENGEEITMEELQGRLTSGALTRDTPIMIVAFSTQHGVLEASEIFDSHGFRHVTISLVTEDPIR